MDQNCIAYPDENDTDFLIELMNMNAINDTTLDLIYNNRVTWEIKLDEGSLVQRIVKLDLDNLALDSIPFSICSDVLFPGLLWSPSSVLPMRRKMVAP